MAASESCATKATLCSVLLLSLCCRVVLCEAEAPTGRGQLAGVNASSSARWQARREPQDLKCELV